MKYTEKISSYWPEFGQNGKEDITVADLLRHEAGLAQFDVPLNVEDTLTGKIMSRLSLFPTCMYFREHQEE